MIKWLIDNHFLAPASFRLLNSEIGNDPEKRCKEKEERHESFRLLNSEIGNDQW